MPKYFYKPKVESTVGTQLELLFKDGVYDNSLNIVSIAEDEEQAFEYARAIINLEAWELDHVEE